MPATVLAGLGVRNASDIEMICGVSEKAAEKRAKRLEELYKRNRFNEHPLERTVRKNFEKFIIILLYENYDTKYNRIQIS